jgi:hypothetical protein
MRRAVVVREARVLAAGERPAERAAGELLGEVADVGGLLVDAREAAEAPAVVGGLEVQPRDRPELGQPASSIAVSLS